MRLAIEKNFWEGKTDQTVHDFCANEINRALFSTVVDIMETKDEKLIQETHINLSLLRAFMDKKMMIGGVI